MRLIPKSLYGRLLGIAALATLAALVFAGVIIGGVLERFVTRGLDERLDTQLQILASAVRADGTIDERRAIDLPRFGEPGSGWQWRVQGTSGRSWSSAADAAALTVPHPRERRRHHADEPTPGDGIDRYGGRLHYRQLEVATPAGPVQIVASGPRAIVEAPLREAIAPLLLSLAVLGCALALATVLQLRVGLRPLVSLRSALADVRAGRRRHVPVDQPTEIAPLAAELNALLDQNEAGLEHARRHVANLAHGLKTPLAALSVRLAESGRDPDGSLGAMVAEIDGRVRHHLGRARAAAPGGGHRMRTRLAPAVADLASVLERIHAARSIRATIEIPDRLTVAVDPQDLDEMVGNLLDNAWRHARAAVRVEAAITDATVHLSISDDGPGMTDAAMREALVPGRRLDERGDGHGFGLSIAEELAQLNGGSLMLGRATAGGLKATLILRGGEEA